MKDTLALIEACAEGIVGLKMDIFEFVHEMTNLKRIVVELSQNLHGL